MTTRVGAALISFGLAISPVRSLCAQDTPGMFARFHTDSTLWQRILTHTVSSLSVYLVRTGVDSNAQPWQMEIPDDAPQRELLLKQLRTILRARAPASGDTLLFTLFIGKPVVSGDTARVLIRTDFGKRCVGSTTLGGFSNADNAFVPRDPRLGWGVARSTTVTHGARVGCAGPW